MKTNVLVKTAFLGLLLSSSTGLAKTKLDSLMDLFQSQDVKSFCAAATSNSLTPVSLKHQVLNQKSAGAWIVFLTDEDFENPRYAQFANFLARDHKVLVVNRRGLLSSDPVNVSNNVLVEDLSALLENLQIEDKLILIGHGFSARTALSFADKHSSQVLGVVALDHDLSQTNDLLSSTSCRTLHAEYVQDKGASLYRRSLMSESMLGMMKNMDQKLFQMTSGEFAGNKEQVLSKIKNHGKKPSRFAKRFIAPGKAEQGLWPLGSAVITQAGNMESQGIKAIVHAASGSMARSGVGNDPTLTSIVDSVKNSIQLAIDNNLKSVAVPLVGGGIFLQRSGATTEDLMKNLLIEAKKYENKIKVVFVMYDAKSFNNLKDVSQAANVAESANFKLVQGSITEFAVHGCEAIINAANTELKFGGGLSGAIGSASGQAQEIDSEAEETLLLNQ